MVECLDITSRYGLARSGKWSILDRSIDIPGIIALAPDAAENANYALHDRLVLAGAAGQKVLHSKDTGEPKNQPNRYPRSKLMVYSRANPLLYNNNGGQKIPPDDPSGSLIAPAVISYPDSLIAHGLSPERIFPNSQVRSSHENGTVIDLVVCNNQELSTKPGLVLIYNALKLMEHPRSFVNRILSLNLRAMPAKLSYLPGIGTANNLAVLLYLGADLIDTYQCTVHARAGLLMTPSGAIHYSNVNDGLCSCSGCSERVSRTTYGPTKNITNVDAELFNYILQHNLNALYSELAFLRSSIASGTLRDVVEQRMVTEPGLGALVRVMDLECFEGVEPFFPINTTTKLNASSREALNRVEVRRFMERVLGRYSKPANAKILVLLPCSAKKPYSASKSHKQFRKAILEAIGGMAQGGRTSSHIPELVHEVIITSPLGLVPRELELVYPARQYDIPVTGYWFEDELKMIKENLAEYLKNNRYEQILIHFSPPMSEFLKACVNGSTKGINQNDSSEMHDNNGPTAPEIFLTASGSPTAKESLGNLTDVLGRLVNIQNKGVKNSDDRLHIQGNLNVLKAVTRYQFGTVGEHLLDDCVIKGRYPNLKFFKNQSQLGMLTGERGFISLTLAGARELLKAPGSGCEVVIGDFKPKGSIMAVGVNQASHAIRMGDEVVAYCDNDRLEPRAVGVAVMNGVEMEKSTRGVAVKVRHHS